MAGYIFWFTYMKATVNTFIGGIMGKNIKFKTTEKSSLAQVSLHLQCQFA